MSIVYQHKTQRNNALMQITKIVFPRIFTCERVKLLLLLFSSETWMCPRMFAWESSWCTCRGKERRPAGSSTELYTCMWRMFTTACPHGSVLGVSLCVMCGPGGTVCFILQSDDKSPVCPVPRIHRSAEASTRLPAGIYSEWKRWDVSAVLLLLKKSCIR